MNNGPVQCSPNFARKRIARYPESDRLIGLGCDREAARGVDLNQFSEIAAREICGERQEVAPPGLHDPFRMRAGRQASPIFVRRNFPGPRFGPDTFRCPA